MYRWTWLFVKVAMWNVMAIGMRHSAELVSQINTKEDHVQVQLNVKFPRKQEQRNEATCCSCNRSSRLETAHYFQTAERWSCSVLESGPFHDFQPWSKSKAVPLHHAATRGRGSTTHFVWGWVVSVVPRPRFTPRKDTRSPLGWRLGGPQSWSGQRG
jgi:hypothetical protein